ncbi:hypothetical protein QQS21_011796 [Conoideocrella luteorostrata]|uniref:Peptidase S1 domain-containing protein n=1 Tax=Conoideocrella luteorostrata TaxID=1105319 RepID=A0AAJ0CCH5_9HYPO|nr:hypothetical protein QQS21_011796 [Conoideocrella luteorostrata]
MLLTSAALFLSAAVPLAAAADANFFNGIPVSGVLYDKNIRQHYCSASVVDSPHGNIIITASHCLSTDGTEMHFAPGYRNGRAPYGTYAIKATYVHPGWNKNFDISLDFAFLTLKKGRYKGRSVNVQEVTGGNRLVINSGLVQTVNVASTAFKEQRPRTCTTKTYKARDGQMALHCDPMQSGTSGAPWVANYNKQTMRGDVIGVVGGLHTGGCTDETTFSCQFTQATLDTYNRAVAGGPGDDVRGGAPEKCKNPAKKKIVHKEPK